MYLRILELFSGIGGMHYAFKHAELPGEIVAAIDINTVANAVYEHNFKKTQLLNKNIQNLSLKMLANLNINTVLMSPPCQPHTRVGQKLDLADPRSDALGHLCEILPKCESLRYVLLENVKGFENSQAHNEFVDALQSAGFSIREFILTPTEFGVPNTRTRYYCLARRYKDFEFSDNKIWTQIPDNMINVIKKQNLIELSTILEKNIDFENFTIPEKLLHRLWVMDIATSASLNTMCFTKSYTHYCEGTGSVYTPLNTLQLDETCKEMKCLEEHSMKSTTLYENLLQKLQLRFFTPSEVARLMSFPDEFDFPEQTTNRQKYRLLGNSINVRVVGELIKLLYL